MPAKLLNIGCGALSNDAWINLDSVPSARNVVRHDITTGLPFPDGSIDVCYASHVLEHLAPAQATDLVGEIHRVLRPSGLVRIVVPDLEAIVRAYQELLDRMVAGNTSREADYDWIMLELLDQGARDFSGGEMGRFLSRDDIQNKDFVISRIGDEARRFWENRDTPLLKRGVRKFKSGGWRWALSFLRARIASWLVQVVAGPRHKAAFDAGVFRSSGEVHRWMYDRFSLGRLLKRAGFGDIESCSAFESRIPAFASYALDVVDGRVRKPDSLFVEASKK